MSLFFVLVYEQSCAFAEAKFCANLYSNKWHITSKNREYYKYSIFFLAKPNLFYLNKPKLYNIQMMVRNTNCI